jgi:hypothetical protein
MSVSSEVQRTLVKSPPELWAELSDPSTLGRHLGELGEISIVRTEPDRAIDWEAATADGARASGRVEIEPSGWGTRVTLSASRALAEPVSEPEPEPIEVIVEPEPEPVAAIEVAPVTSEGEPETDPEVEATGETKAIVEVEPQIVEPAPRLGFFARLFRWRRQPEPEPTAKPAVGLGSEPVAVVEAEKSGVEETPSEEPAPEGPVSEEPSLESSSDTPEPDISAELAELEEQTTAVLTGVLDRLGAAHHRPFSRS